MNIAMKILLFCIFSYSAAFILLVIVKVFDSELKNTRRIMTCVKLFLLLAIVSTIILTFICIGRSKVETRDDEIVRIIKENLLKDERDED